MAYNSAIDHGGVCAYVDRPSDKHTHGHHGTRHSKCVCFSLFAYGLVSLAWAESPIRLTSSLTNQGMMFDEFDSFSGVVSIRAADFLQGPDHRQNNDFLKIRVQLLE